MTDFPTTIAEIAPLVLRGEVRPSELVEACLTRIEALEPELHAWVDYDLDEVRRAAAEADDELSRGNYRGPLHGIPLGVKDIVDVAGWPTRCGSLLTSDNLAEHDAPVVAQLRAAGAILLGKTVTTEFASFDPPPTRNPWNWERTPGGSSSGSAAAVAVGMCWGAIGTQTGGSITRPASYCGIAGCKPTFGRVSRAGVMPFADHLDHVGPMARCVADLQLLLAAMQEEFCDPINPSDSPAREPLRVGLVEDFFLERADKEAAAAVRNAAKQLAAAGAEVRLVSLPESFAEVHAMHRRIMAVEAAKVHEKLYAERFAEYSPRIAELLEEGLNAEPAAYQVALAHQQRFAQEMTDVLANCDALLTPATTSAAPAKSSTGDPAFNSPWSYSGLPTVSFPCALDGDDLPLSLQLIGRAWDDGPLLAAARWCERAIGFAAPPGR